ncbi:MAG: hypothetical protein Q9186_006979 [Xanthomendoza sp. 1 TL-2023]
MTPPTKRRHLSAFEKADSKQNADAEFQKQRTRSTRKLKSTFEAIFEKYSKDFTGIGDVIDFNTDSIIVNNGHVEDMVDEKDAGDHDQSSSDGEADDQEDEVNDQEEEGHEVGDEDEERTAEADGEGEEKEEGDALSSAEPGRTQSGRTIPDSQDIGSSDEDPLSMLKDGFSEPTSPLSEGGGVLLFQSKFDRYKDSNASIFRPRTAPLRHQDDLVLEEAWRFPLLPQDINIQKSLPSPSPSLNSDSDLPRSASPTGESIWALPKRTHQPKTPGISWSHRTSGPPSKPTDVTKSTPWTQAEKRLLRQLKALKKSWTEIQLKFPNRTPAALQSHWRDCQKRSGQIDTMQSGKLQSNRSSHKSLKRVRNRHHTQAEQLVSDRPLQTIASDAMAASSQSKNTDAELEDDLVLAPEKSTEPNHSSSDDQQQRMLQPGMIVPDSQDTIEVDQLPDQVHYSPLCAPACSPFQGLQDEDDNPLLSVSSRTRTISNPLLLGSSSEDSPNANDEYTQSRRSGQECQNMPSTAAWSEENCVHSVLVPGPIHLQSRAHEISASQRQGTEVLIKDCDTSKAEDALQQLAAITQSPDAVMCLQNKPASKAALPKQQLDSPYPAVKEVASGTNRVPDQMDIVIADESGESPDVEISKTPSLLAKAHGGPDRAAISDDNGDRIIAPSNAVSRQLSEARHIPTGSKDPQPERLPPARRTAADFIGRPRTTFQKFLRVEIPTPRSKTPDACSTELSKSPGVPPSEMSTTFDAPPQELSTIPVTPPGELARNPGTPPRELLPAQEESLRKIKPFSLILPTDGSPAIQNPVQSRSPYLQSLNQKYRLNQGVMLPNTRSPSVRKKFSEQPAMQSIPMPQPAMDSIPALIGDQGYAKDSSTTVHGLELDGPRLSSAPDERQLLPTMEDEDDLQLPIQPAVGLSLQSKIHLVSSGNEQRLPFRPRIVDMDLSDDELSTPIKTLQNRVKMTPEHETATAHAPRVSSRA